MNKIFLLFLCLLIAAASYGEKLPIPRFVSIKSKEANARRGPGIKYPIEWVFVKKGEPAEIIAEYEQWRRIKDFDGEGGWVHLSVLSGKRYVVISSKKNAPILKAPKAESEKIAEAEPGARCKTLTCKDSFCKIECLDIKGWIEKKFLWGVYPNENL